jgi:hypothetical protein
VKKANGIEYDVVIADDLEAFAQSITDRMADGWSCQGGISVGYDTWTDQNGNQRQVPKYHQAMVKK